MVKCGSHKHFNMSTRGGGGGGGAGVGGVLGSLGGGGGGEEGDVPSRSYVL